MDNPNSDSSISKIYKIMKDNPSRIPILAIEGIEAIFLVLFVLLFGRLAYERRYLRGKWFRYIWSPGWRWAFNGMFRKLLTGHGRGVPWPIGPSCDCSKDVEFDSDVLNLFQVPTYYQAFHGTKIKIGHNVWIARGCCIITTNHDLKDPSIHQTGESVEIGDHCWLGANVVVMPGVVLGPHTIVGANAVVTKSFPDGYGVLAGVPAKLIHRIDAE